jgi:hypothetical protein
MTIQQLRDLHNSVQSTGLKRHRVRKTKDKRLRVKVEACSDRNVTVIVDGLDTRQVLKAAPGLVGTGIVVGTRGVEEHVRENGRRRNLLVVQRHRVSKEKTLVEHRALTKSSLLYFILESEVHRERLDNKDFLIFFVFFGFRRV